MEYENDEPEAEMTQADYLAQESYAAAMQAAQEEYHLRMRTVHCDICGAEDRGSEKVLREKMGTRSRI